MMGKGYALVIGKYRGVDNVSRVSQWNPPAIFYFHLRRKQSGHGLQPEKKLDRPAANEVIRIELQAAQVSGKSPERS